MRRKFRRKLSQMESKKANSREIKGMVMVDKFSKMVVDTKVNGKIIKRTGMVLHIQMVVSILVILRKINLMD